MGVSVLIGLRAPIDSPANTYIPHHIIYTKDKETLHGERERERSVRRRRQLWLHGGGRGGRWWLVHGG